MQAFMYSYPTKVYFGEGAAASAPAAVTEWVGGLEL